MAYVSTIDVIIGNNVCRFLLGTLSKIHLFVSRSIKPNTQLSFERLPRRCFHSRTFVDPLTEANTQKIEGLWDLVKQKFKAMKGIDPKYLQDYLDEFTFRRTFENSPITLFGEMLLTISRYWNQVGNMDDFDYVDLLEEDGRERVPIG